MPRLMRVRRICGLRRVPASRPVRHGGGRVNSGYHYVGRRPEAEEVRADAFLFSRLRPSGEVLAILGRKDRLRQPVTGIP